MFYRLIKKRGGIKVVECTRSIKIGFGNNYGWKSCSDEELVKTIDNLLQQ